MKWLWLLIIPVYLWLNIPSFHDGLFNVIDNVQVTRTEAVYNELMSGQFPVRYIDNFGQNAGYFIMKYYSPLVYYLGAIFHMAGFSVIQSVKLVYLLMTAIGGIGIYLLLWSLFKSKLATTLGTIAFLTAPYLYHDFFHRGALPESAAFMLVPWVWWSFWQIKKNPKGIYIVYGALSLALAYVAHSLTGMSIMGSLVILLLIPQVKAKALLRGVLAIILGLGIAAFSLVPPLMERNIIQYENNALFQTGYLDHPVPLLEEFIGKTGQSAYLGATLMISFMVLLAIVISSKNFYKKYDKLIIFITIMGFGGLFMVSPMSRAIWANISYLRYYQFQFRLLTVITTAMVLGYAILVDYFAKKRWVITGLVLLIFVPVVTTIKYYRPVSYQYGTRYTVDDPCQTTTWVDEYLSKWTSKCLLKPLPEIVTPADQNIKVENVVVSENGRKINFQVIGQGEVQVAKYYSPEWQAYDNQGEKLSTTPYGESGLIKVTTTNPEETNVVLQMKPSNASRLGDTLSLISMFICLGIVFWKRRGVVKPQQEE